MYINLYYFNSLYMSYRVIAAMGRNYGIGYNGRMPWNVPSDMQQFTKLTKGAGNNAVIMGRTTWDSISCAPLKGRDNIVMSRDIARVWNAEQTAGVAKSMSEVIAMCAERNYDDIWVIGGAQVYRQFLTHAPCVSCHLTYIEGVYPADTFFPIDIISRTWITESCTHLSDAPYAELHVLENVEFENTSS